MATRHTLLMTTLGFLKDIATEAKILLPRSWTIFRILSFQ